MGEIAGLCREPKEDWIYVVFSYIGALFFLSDFMHSEVFLDF